MVLNTWYSYGIPLMGKKIVWNPMLAFSVKVAFDQPMWACWLSFFEVCDQSSSQYRHCYDCNSLKNNSTSMCRRFWLETYLCPFQSFVSRPNFTPGHHSRCLAWQIFFWMLRGWEWHLERYFCSSLQKETSNPIQSKYGVFPYIYHTNKPNVGKYTIHGWYGDDSSYVKTRRIHVCDIFDRSLPCWCQFVRVRSIALKDQRVLFLIGFPGFFSPFVAIADGTKIEIVAPNPISNDRWSFRLVYGILNNIFTKPKNGAIF